MESDTALLIFCFAFFFAAAALLSALKTALACCRLPRLRSLAENDKKNAGKKIGRLVDRLRDPEETAVLLQTLRIVILFCELFSGVSAIMIFEHPVAAFAGASGISVPFILLLYTAVFFLFAESLPRRIARTFPESLTIALFPLARFCAILGAPLLAVDRALAALTEVLSKSRSAGGRMTEEELRLALLEGEKSGVVESEERTMVEGVFYLGDKPAGTFMTHRSDVVYLDIDATAEEAGRAACDEDAPRFFPVVRGSLDDTVGAVSRDDILSGLLRAKSGSGPFAPGARGLAELMKPPVFVPETMSALKTFEAFKKADADCLFVMDEYGGFSGLLTVRNLVEEIVGDLSDSPGDGDEIVRTEDGAWLADGSVNIDDAAAALGLPEIGERSEYHTLAGFVLNLAGEIPKAGSYFDSHGYRFTVVDMDGNRIDKVMIRQI